MACLGTCSLLSKPFVEPDLPVLYPLSHQGLQWSNVHSLALRIVV